MITALPSSELRLTVLPSAGGHGVYRSGIVEGWDSMMRRPRAEPYRGSQRLFLLTVNYLSWRTLYERISHADSPCPEVIPLSSPWLESSLDVALFCNEFINDLDTPKPTQF